VEFHLVSGYPLYCAEAANRGFNFYGVTYTPDVYIDGDQTSGSYEAMIVNRMNQPAPVAESLWGMYIPGRGDGTVFAQFRNDSSASITGRVYFVIVEDSCYYVAPNGDVWHNDVARDYLPDELGETVTIAAGDSVTFSRSFTIPSGWNEDNILLYTWFQKDTGDKEVYQACIIELEDLIGAPSIPAIVQPFDCIRVPEPQPTLVLYSIDPQNDDIVYRVAWDTDPDFLSADSFTSSLQASGDTFYFTFPYALTDGETYWFKARTSDPNGSALWTPYTGARSLTVLSEMPGNTCSWFQTTGVQFGSSMFFATMIQGDSIILIPGGAAMIDTCFFEDFESGTMPAGWTVVNGNSDPYQWTVGTSGDMGTYTPPDYGSHYAYYSDDDAGSSVINYNEELISPAIPIPAGIDNLDIAYGYGFRVYQTGEKFRVKMRYFQGSWSAWADIAVYTTNTSGTEIFDLTPYLPCDSVQFDWFFSDSTSASHWGYGAACDNVALRYEFTTSGDEGSVTGAAVEFDDLAGMYNRPNWGSALWFKATAGDSIGMQVEYHDGSAWDLIPDTDLPGNSSGFYTSLATDTVDLSSLNTTTYHTLRLVTQFYRIPTDDPDDPALLAWELGNLENVIGIAEHNTSVTTIHPVLKVVPTISKNAVNIYFAVNAVTPATSLKIYDAAGRLVTSFHLTPDAPGTTLQWDGRDDAGRRTPAGIYFVKLDTENTSITQKVLLVR
jgi:hypothetical protein